MRYVVALIFVCVWLVGGCGPPKPSVVASKQTQVSPRRVEPEKPTVAIGSYEVDTINLSAAETLGNHTWLPINREGNLDDHNVLILQVIDRFETVHAELEVYDVDVQLRSSHTDDRVLGVWIHHRPKTK